MKKLLLLTAAIFTLAVPTTSQANPAFLFVATTITGGFVATTYEDCKAEGLDAKECASKTWAERKRVPITQEVYKQDFNQ